MQIVKKEITINCYLTVQFSLTKVNKGYHLFFYNTIIKLNFKRNVKFQFNFLTVGTHTHTHICIVATIRAINY